MPIKTLLVASALLSQSNNPQTASTHRQFSPQEAAIAKEARAGVEAFLAAWNTGSSAELNKVVRFPFITIRQDGRVGIAQTPEEFQPRMFERLREEQHWDHSTFDSIEPVWIDREKAHFKVQWSRHNTDGARYLTGQILYVLNKVDGAWKIQVRSSLSFERLN